MSDTPSQPVLPPMADIMGSSQIARIGHDAKKNHLFVQFWRKPTNDETNSILDNVPASGIKGDAPMHHRRVDGERGVQITGVPGSIYRYDDVTPEHHAAFMAADSKGSHFGVNFKKNPRHATTKLS
jgi:KTSC domain